MTDQEFNRMMRRRWGRLAVVLAAVTATLATVFALGLLKTLPGTGSGLGVMAVLAVAATGCWAHFHDKTNPEGTR